jgi:hypothetical protein
VRFLCCQLRREDFEQLFVGSDAGAPNWRGFENEAVVVFGSVGSTICCCSVFVLWLWQRGRMRLVARAVYFPGFLLDVSVIVLRDVVAGPELGGLVLRCLFALPPIIVNGRLFKSLPRVKVSVSSVLEARDGTGCLCGLVCSECRRQRRGKFP